MKPSTLGRWCTGAPTSSLATASRRASFSGNAPTSLIEDFRARTAQVRFFTCWEFEFLKTCKMWNRVQELQPCHSTFLLLAVCCTVMRIKQHKLTNAVFDCKFAVVLPACTVWKDCHIYKCWFWHLHQHQFASHTWLCAWRCPCEWRLRQCFFDM